MTEFGRWPPAADETGRTEALNGRLSGYVRHAASNETVPVTDRDCIVAQFGPLGESRRSVLDDAVLAEPMPPDVFALPGLESQPKSVPVSSLDEVLAERDESRRDRRPNPARSHYGCLAGG